MFTTKSGTAIRLRTTIVIESESQAQLEEALKQAVGLAESRVMQMSFRASTKDDAAYISVRTTRAKKPR